MYVHGICVCVCAWYLCLCLCECERMCVFGCVCVCVWVCVYVCVCVCVDRVGENSMCTKERGKSMHGQNQRAFRSLGILVM